MRAAFARTGVGWKRGDFGISARAYPPRLGLSISTEGARHDPARRPFANRLPAVRGPRPDRPDRTLRGAVAHSEFDLPALRQDRRAHPRPQGVAADAGCDAVGGAATRRAPCPRRIRPGDADGGRGSAGLDRAAAGARSVFSVCAGALLCGAAGLLRGRRATTHWASFHLLPYFGAIPVNQRVVVDGNWVFAAGVTAGIDGALRLAAELRGEDVAQTIQLYMAYAPEPPFNSGTPETAPRAILERARQSAAGITAKREETACR